MTLRRRIALVVAVGAAIALLAPSGAFGSMTAERPVSLDVVDAPDQGGIALVETPTEIGLTYGSNDDSGNDDAVTGHQGPVALLTVQNNHDGSLTVEASLDGDDSSPPKATDLRFESGGTDVALSPGETAVVVADVVCAAHSSEQWTVTVGADVDGTWTSHEHDVTVTCTGPPGGGPGGPPGGTSGGPP